MNLLRSVPLIAASLLTAAPNGSKEVVVTNGPDQPVPVAVQSFAPTVDVAVTNSTSSPVPVTDAAAAQQSVTLTGNVQMLPGVRGSSGSLYNAPSGEFLAIDHVSVHGFTPTGQKLVAWLRTTNGPSAFDQYLVTTDEGGGFLQLLPDQTLQTSEVFRDSENPRIYLPPEGNLTLFGLRNDTAGFAQVDFTIVGHLVPAGP